MQSSSLFNYLFVFVVGALAGLAVTAIAATRPKCVWLLLIAGSIVTAGMMPRGYTLVDEYLTACLLFGVLLLLAISAETRVRMNGFGVTRLHWFFFLLMIAYMIFQSMRGVIELESLRKMRWVVFYVMLGLLPIVLHTRKFPIPSRRQTVLTITLSTLVYLIVYIIHGLMAEFFGGISRFDLQLVWWGTTAYSLLPIVVVMPAIIICLRDTSKRYRRAGWSTLFVSIAAAFYYDSRVALLSILGFIVVALPILGIRRSIRILLLFSVVLFVFLSFLWPSYRDLAFFTEDLFTSGGALWQQPGKLGSMRDIDRYVQMQAAFRSIAANWKTLLFGYGFRTHGWVISPHLRALYEEYGRPDLAARVSDDAGTEGFTALVVDTGLTGLLLLVVNFVLVAWQILRKKHSKYRYVILLSAVMLFLWLFVINMLDIILFYLAIMPSGLLLLLSRPTLPQHRMSRGGISTG